MIRIPICITALVLGAVFSSSHAQKVATPENTLLWDVANPTNLPLIKSYVAGIFKPGATNPTHTVATATNGLPLSYLVAQVPPGVVEFRAAPISQAGVTGYWSASSVLALWKTNVTEWTNDVPVFLGVQVHVSRNAGASVKLSPEVGGVAPMTFQWFFAGRSLPGETNQSLLLQNCSQTSEGSYEVRVENRMGVARSAPIELLLRPAVTNGMTLIIPTGGIAEFNNAFVAPP